MDALLGPSKGLRPCLSTSGRDWSTISYRDRADPSRRWQRLFEDLDGAGADYECIEVVSSHKVSHIRLTRTR
jgi:hypothetical protein